MPDHGPAPKPYMEDVENPVAALSPDKQEALVEAATGLINLIRQYDLPWYQALVKFQDGERFVLDWRNEKEWAGGRTLRKAVNQGGVDIGGRDGGGAQ